MSNLNDEDKIKKEESKIPKKKKTLISFEKEVTVLGKQTLERCPRELNLLEGGRGVANPPSVA